MIIIAEVSLDETIYPQTQVSIMGTKFTTISCYSYEDPVWKKSNAESPGGKAFYYYIYFQDITEENSGMYHCSGADYNGHVLHGTSQLHVASGVLIT